MRTIEGVLAELADHWDDAPALARLGAELHSRNRLDHAIRVLSRALEIDPKVDPDAWQQLSFAYYRNWRDKEGTETLRKGIEATDSDSIRASLGFFLSDEEELATLWARLETSPEPSVRLACAARRFYNGEAGGLDAARKILAENPEDQDTIHQFLWLLLSASARGADVDLRAEGLPLTGMVIAEEPAGTFGAWMKIRMLLKLEDHDGVLEETGRILALLPDDETFMQFRGQAYREKGDLDRAIACFSRAIGMKQNFAGARVDLGKLYEKQGRLDLAEETFREIPVANPGYPVGPMSLAFFFARQGRLDEAETLFVETWPGLPSFVKGSLSASPDMALLKDREAVKKVMEADDE